MAMESQRRFNVVKFFDQERGPSKLWSWHTRGILISIPNTSLQLFLEGVGGSNDARFQGQLPLRDQQA